MIYMYDKNNVKVRRSVSSDIEAITENLREKDRQEIEAVNGRTPHEALSHGMLKSAFCVTVLHKGTPVAMFGIVPDKAAKKAGVVWLLGTDGINDMKTTFLRLSRRYIRLMMTRFHIMFNFVDARNVESVRWLKWCGAKIDEARPYGKDGLPFHFFAFFKGAN